ncbi:hypothetical protein ACEN2T_20030, partial [Pseudomonas sp. W22_MBD1_FP4]|uniref:hypothetical protein n=1 Tax=Pseudomonas sp. W22_MBD1_FP4 TaxID=3240272 RepID=UPI003F953F8A
HQREANSTALHAAVNTSFSTSFWLRWTEATYRRKLRNSLFTKEFSVSTAPEVGRIIDRYNSPSTLNFNLIQI